MYEFSEYEMAVQQKQQRMMDEAREWRRLREVMLSTEPESKAAKWLQPVISSLFILLER